MPVANVTGPRQNNYQSAPQVNPNIKVVCAYKFPVYSGQDFNTRWWPGKPDSKQVCLVDISVEIEGVRGTILFKDAVVMKSERDGKYIALAATTYQKHIKNKDGQWGERDKNHDWGMDIAIAIKEQLNDLDLVDNSLNGAYDQWCRLLAEFDPDFLGWLFANVYQTACPYLGQRPAPQAAPVVAPVAQAPVATPPAAPPAAGRPAGNRPPRPAPAQAPPATDYDEVEDPFATE